MEEEERFMRLVRYFDSNLDIWNWKSKQLENNVKNMEDKEKGVHLYLKEHGRIVFLDVEIKGIIYGRNKKIYYN